MSRWWIAIALLAGVAAAQDRPKLVRREASDGPKKEQTKEPAANAESGAEGAAGDVQLPEEEDKSVVPKQYSFNPLQSKKEVSVGAFYLKKGDFNAAANRFLEATRWNDGNADAWLRLGEASEKRNDAKAAREAYEKYLELAPTAKNAAEIHRRLEKLKN